MRQIQKCETDRAIRVDKDGSGGEKRKIASIQYRLMKHRSHKKIEMQWAKFALEIEDERIFLLEFFSPIIVPKKQ